MRGDISFGEITRGSGKIFVYVRISASLADRHLAPRVSAKVDDGAPVPALLLQNPTSVAYVVVLPILSTRQNVRVSFQDASGAEVAHAERSLSAQEAKRLSQINTLTHNKVALRIRNADEAWNTGSADIELSEIHPDGEKSIVRGTITSFPKTASNLPAFDVQILESNGESIALRPWVNMGDRVVTDPRSASGLRRTTSFSLLVPAAVPMFILWVRCAEDPSLDAFLCCQADVVADKRLQGEDLFRDVEFDPRYDGWFRDLHRTSPYELERQRRAPFAHKPLFSLVLPASRDCPDTARKTINSVLSQTYDRLELLIVGELAADLQPDPRTHIVTDTGAGKKPSASLVEGVAQAAGQFTCLLAPGDTLEPDTLWRYAQALERYPQTDLLYCDEDKFDGTRYVEPYFKSDLNHDLLMCQDYIGTFVCVRTPLAQQLELDPARDAPSFMYDLTLKAVEQARNIYHERRVLYHTSMRQDPYDAPAMVTALQGHLDRTGINARAEADPHVPRATRVRYNVPRENGPLVSILIPNKDLTSTLERCLDSLSHKLTYQNFEVIVIENGSTQDETFELYRRIPQLDTRMRVVTYMPDAPGFSYSKVMNFGASQARGAFLLTLNNDTEVVSPDLIEQLLGPLTRDEVGAVGAKLLYPDGTIQHGGASFVVRHNGPWHEGTMEPANSAHYHHYLQLSRDVPCVTGACTMTSRALWERLGGLDERFVVDYNDVDFCLRLLELGKLVVYNPHAVLLHHESLSRGDHWMDLQFCRDEGMLMRRWARYYIQGDSYTGPHLFGPHRTLYLESA